MADRAGCRAGRRRHAVVAGLLAPPVAVMAAAGFGRARRRRAAARCPARPARPGWRSARTARCWPAAMRDGTVRLWNVATGQSYGPPLQAGSAGRTGIAFSPDGSCWPEATPTARSGCGVWPPASRRFAAAGGQRRDRAGVQSRRHAAGQRRGRRPRPAVEPGHRPAGRFAAAGGQRGARGGVQPGRHAAGQRRRQRRHPAVGRGHRPARPCRCGRRARARWRSARTARCWPAATPTARSGCGTRPPASRPARRCRRAVR